ncbi:MAG: Gfo/Idh/MocA family protein [Planctomycetota bacterium]|jgi:predicted dehydrogenase
MIRLGLLGFGAWGRNVARVAASTPGARLVAIADPEVARRAEAATRHPGVDIVSHDTELIERGDIDAVLIASTAHSHAEIALRAAAAGKHMLVEKPFALDPGTALEMAAAAEKADVRMQVGHLLRYHPAAELLLGIATDELGPIRCVAAQRLNFGKVRHDENVLFSLGPHDLSLMLQLFGETPVSVSAQGAAFVREGVEDLCFVTLRFPSGGIGQLHLSWLDPHKVRRLTVVGERRMAVFDDMEPREKIRIYDQGFDTNGNSGVNGGYSVYGENLAHRSGGIRIPVFAATEPLAVEISEFVACVADGRTPRTPAADGVLVTEVLDAAQRSMRDGGKPLQLG